MLIWLLGFGAALGAGWLLGGGDAAANARAAEAAAPAALLTAMLGVTLGLFGRERVRLRRTYASPTAAYLGKRLLWLALGAAGVYALSPVAWPAGCVPLFAAAAALGALAWLSNLPSRL